MEQFEGIVLDLEMTGLNTKTDKIIEIGAIKIRGDEIVDEYHQMICPGRLLSPNTVKLTGITDDMLKGEKDFGQIKDDFLEFCGGDIIMGHHIIHDYAFLKRAVLSASPKGCVFERRGVDTLKIARSFLPADQKKSLSALCEYFDIPMKAHRAVEDARATFALYLELKKRFYDQKPEAFQSVELHYQVKREVPIMKKQIEQIEKLLALYQLECPYDLTKLTKNEASRYVDEIKRDYAGKASL